MMVRQPIKDVDFYLFKDVIREFLEFHDGKGLSENKMYIINKISEKFGEKFLTEIKPDNISKWIQSVVAKPATRNTYVYAFRKLIKFAYQKDWCRLFEIPLWDVPKFEDWTFFTQEEIDMIVHQIPRYTDVRHAQAFKFACATGLRQGNVYGLRWDQVHLEDRYILFSANDMKSTRSHRVSLNTDIKMILMPESKEMINFKATQALEVLEFMQGKHEGLVFGGDRILHNTFKSVLKNCGIGTHHRWHATRHSFATHLIQSGVPDSLIVKLGSWSSADMLDRYAHYSDDYLTR